MCRRLPARVSATILRSPDRKSATLMTHPIVTLQTVPGTGWNTIQEQLDSAHEAVQSLAIAEGQNGVLIIRHRPGTYTLAVSPEVPYGMTYERDDPRTHQEMSS